MTQLRIALTISGAVSLGAYEGGALAALLVAVQELSEDGAPPIRIDAIAGASAGSITGLLAARSLLNGLDPVYVMHESWVRRDSLERMRTRDPHALLSVEALRKDASDLLQPPKEFSGRPVQQQGIKIHMSLACLRGLTYRLARLHGRPIESTTYLDWGTFTLAPKATLDEYLEPTGASPLDFALASGANALGFPPAPLNRTLREEDQKQLARGEIIDLPDPWSGWLWYTDGGTIENQPLGRAVDLANEIDKDGLGRRLALLIHPHPATPPKDDSWAEPNRRPPWITTLARADRIQRTQSLYEDLRRAEKTNSRLEWTQRLLAVLEGAVDDKARAQLADLVGKFRAEKTAIGRHEAEAVAAEGPAAEGATKELLEEALQFATGLSGKHAVAVDVVSPLLLDEAGKTSVENLLAGEFLGHFGGFLNEDLRMSDFVLGYRSMLRWLERLGEYDVSPDLAQRAYRAARRRVSAEWDRFRFGTKTMRDLPLNAKIDLGRLAAHAARVTIGELISRSRP